MLTSRTTGKYAVAGLLTGLCVACHIETADLGNSGAGQSASARGGATQGTGGANSASGGSVIQGGSTPIAAGGSTGGVPVAAGGTTVVASGGAPVASGGTTVVAAGGAPVASGGTTVVAAGGAPVASGGTGSGGPCECPSEPVSWGPNGGLDATNFESTLDCSGFRRTFERFPPDFPTYQCDLPNVRCYDDWSDELASVMALRQNADVQSALDAAPILYGHDSRPVDGAVFSFQVGGKRIDIGDPCRDFAACVDAPPGVVAYAEALKKLERHAALDCSPECAPTPPVPSAQACSEPKFYWMYGSCEQVSGRGCDTGYDTELDCVNAHAQCAGLFVHRCGGFAGDTCADDEYCAYRGNQDCGRADGSAVCLPKPHACDLVGAPVCGCDNVTYGNLCEAALAGVGESDVGECRK